LVKVTQERFLKLMDNPELLSTISYEELKTIALSYPFSNNLRVLLALKARQENAHDASRVLATAAAYSIDRTQLFLMYAPKIVTPQTAGAEEVVLELKPIETVRRELESLSPLERGEKTVATPAEKAMPNPEQTESPALDLSTARPTPAPPIVPKFIEPEPLPFPNAPQSFAGWYSRFNPPVLAPKLRKEDDAPAPMPEPEKTKSPAQMLAERSVSENKDVLSETLAKIYAAQGHKERAIAMYERLILAFPEKSENFAAAIQKLKN
jgi:hypothetical protein